MTDLMEDRDHLNLYYIFEKDKAEHPMPQEQVRFLQETLRESACEEES
jgi:hypothetical protein